MYNTDSFIILRVKTKIFSLIIISCEMNKDELNWSKSNTNRLILHTHQHFLGTFQWIIFVQRCTGSVFIDARLPACHHQYFLQSAFCAGFRAMAGAFLRFHNSRYQNVLVLKQQNRESYFEVLKRDFISSEIKALKCIL